MIYPCNGPRESASSGATPEEVEINYADHIFLFVLPWIELGF